MGLAVAAGAWRLGTADRRGAVQSLVVVTGRCGRPGGSGRGIRVGRRRLHPGEHESHGGRYRRSPDDRVVVWRDLSVVCDPPGVRPAPGPLATAPCMAAAKCAFAAVVGPLRAGCLRRVVCGGAPFRARAEGSGARSPQRWSRRVDRRHDPARDARAAHPPTRPLSRRPGDPPDAGAALAVACGSNGGCVPDVGSAVERCVHR